MSSSTTNTNIETTPDTNKPPLPLPPTAGVSLASPTTTTTTTRAPARSPLLTMPNTPAPPAAPPAILTDITAGANNQAMAAAQVETPARGRRQARSALERCREILGYREGKRDSPFFSTEAQPTEPRFLPLLRLDRQPPVQSGPCLCQRAPQCQPGGEVELVAREGRDRQVLGPPA
ncbi:hypothetical protein LZ554_005229 [Drepanopeziza brunnea f. sp. 'monogermtubi']|nr:hypothetical protein LZ554_005229 [Drepanopeziza brunnea f. sp. 'monogermtubi']